MFCNTGKESFKYIWKTFWVSSRYIIVYNINWTESEYIDYIVD